MAWKRKKSEKHPSQESVPGREVSRLASMSEPQLRDWTHRLLFDAGQGLSTGDRPLLYSSVDLLFKVVKELESRDAR